MDPEALGILIPSGSVVAVLATLIIHQMRQNNADRKQYREDVARVEQRAADDLAERDEAHRQVLQEVRDEVKGVRSELAAVREELDAERKARWKAQDDAAGYKRELDLIRNGAPS